MRNFDPSINYFAKEADFRFNELFFTRTDGRGVIKSSNHVFKRVNECDWEGVLNIAHSFVRHPATPRGLFYYFWEEIQAGRNIGSYIVNLTKENSYYWVYALVFPLDDGGFLSVRLKPSSPLFEKIKGIYEELVLLEKTKKITPQESSIILQEKIQQLGFKDYSSFMAEALITEIKYRQEAQHQTLAEEIRHLYDLKDSGDKLQQCFENMSNAYELNAYGPLNLKIQAARIGQKAAAVDVIASHYDTIAQAIGVSGVGELTEMGNLFKEELKEMQIKICSSFLQKEMLHLFNIENDESSPIQKDVEIEHLQKLSARGITRAQKSLESVKNEYQKFIFLFADLKKQLTTMEITGITAKIEAARLGEHAGELTTLIEGIDHFKNILKDSLREIDDIGQKLIQRIQRISDIVASNRFDLSSAHYQNTEFSENVIDFHDSHQDLIERSITNSIINSSDAIDEKELELFV